MTFLEQGWPSSRLALPMPITMAAPAKLPEKALGSAFRSCFSNSSSRLDCQSQMDGPGRAHHPDSHTCVHKDEEVAGGESFRHRSWQTRALHPCLQEEMQEL